MTEPPLDNYSRDRVIGQIDLAGLPVVGIAGTCTSRTYAVSLPWWARLIRSAAEAVVTWTKRFEKHTRIG